LPFIPLHVAGEEARLKAVLTKDELRRLESVMTGEYPMSEKTRSEISHLRAGQAFTTGSALKSGPDILTLILLMSRLLLPFLPIRGIGTGPSVQRSKHSALQC